MKSWLRGAGAAPESRVGVGPGRRWTPSARGGKVLGREVVVVSILVGAILRVHILAAAQPTKRTGDAAACGAARGGVVSAGVFRSMVEW